MIKPAIEVNREDYLRSQDYKESQLSLGYRPKVERDLNPRAGFDLGWDYFVYKMTIPFAMQSYKDVADGFGAAKQQGVKQKECNDYVRKWLLLRANAWKRNRIFDASVTPELLQIIEPTECPITKVKLTKHTGQESDWSIDRITNDASYCLGNIVIVSTRANRLKGNYSIDEIIKFAYDYEVELPKGKDGYEPLSRIEWARWAFVCSLAPIASYYDEDGDQRFKRYKYMMPCVIQAPNGLIQSVSALIQMAIAEKTFDFRKDFDRISGLVPKSTRQELNHLVKFAKKRKLRVSSPYEIWHDLKLFDLFCDFMNNIAEETLASIMKSMEHYTMESTSTDDIDFGDDTKGYAVDIRSQTLIAA